MRRKPTVRMLILPLVLAFALLLPLLGAAVIAEHRYEKSHPAYLKHFLLRALGEEETVDELPTGAENGKLNVLVVGKDKAAGLTDVMMLASLDTERGSLQLLQIPRDTYAAYTDRDYKKINGAYARLGGEGLSDFLETNLGVTVDRYVCVDLDVLGDMVDQMGGVRMNVPSDMDYDDPDQNLHIHIKAGEQVLDGDAAQSFVRFRSGYLQADVGRMDAQKLFLSALAKQAKENLSLAQTVSLVCRSFGKIKTDMTLNDCIACAKQLRGVSLSDLHMATLPGASTRTGGNSGAWYYVLNRDATAQLLERTVGTRTDFDPNGVFNDASRSSFDRIYRASADSVQIHEYTAQGALDGELTVRRVG